MKAVPYTHLGAPLMFETFLDVQEQNASLFAEKDQVEMCIRDRKITYCLTLWKKQENKKIVCHVRLQKTMRSLGDPAATMLPVSYTHLPIKLLMNVVN